MPSYQAPIWFNLRLAPARSALVALMALGCASSPGVAQTVYKSVGPDGKVTFSDRPPPDIPTAVVGKPNKGTTESTAGAANPALPFELKQISGKYPVTLYSTSNCGACDAGRTLLSNRGVPFREKTVNTNEDIGAFSRISKENSMPLLTIGGQQVKGYSETEWSQYLDSAGYPKQSALPSSYRQPAAEPMSPLKTAAEAGTDTDTASPPKPVSNKPAPPIDRASNPAGIRF